MGRASRRKPTFTQPNEHAHKARTWAQKQRSPRPHDHSNVAHCDFCSDTLPFILFVAKPSTDQLLPGVTVKNDAGWLACAECARLVYTGNRTGLWRRSFANLGEVARRAGIRMTTQAERADASRIIQHVHARFWDGYFEVSAPYLCELCASEGVSTYLVPAPGSRDAVPVNVSYTVPLGVGGRCMARAALGDREGLRGVINAMVERGGRAADDQTRTWMTATHDAADRAGRIDIMLDWVIAVAKGARGRMLTINQWIQVMLQSEQRHAADHAQPSASTADAFYYTGPAPFDRAIELQADLAGAHQSDAGYMWMIGFLGIENDPKLARMTRREILETGRLVSSTTVRALLDGECYLVTPDIATTVRHATGQFPDIALRSEDLIAPAGFVVFEKPMTLGIGDERQPRLKAFSWITTGPATGSFNLTTSHSAEALHMEGARGLGVAPDEADGISLCYFYVEEDAPESQRQIRALTGFPQHLPLLLSSTVWPLGKSAQATAASKDIRPDTTDVGPLDQRLRFTHALLTFMESKIYQRAKARPGKDATKRVLKRGWHYVPHVNVIVLRRTEYDRRAGSGESRLVDWSCQWEVGGHQHTYHTKDGTVKKWLKPYRKGPKNKPFRGRSKVHSVER